MAVGHLPGGPYLVSGRPNTARSNPRDVNLLAEPLKSRVKAMIADCPWPDELGTISAVRDPGTQWDLRRERVGLANIWNSRVQGRIITAIPARWNYATQEWEGGSHHQTGDAHDFTGTARAMQWMRDNRERYGLALTVRSEGWHVEADRRDVFTGRLHNNPTALADRPAPKPPAKPTPPPIPKDWFDMATKADLKAALSEVLADPKGPLTPAIHRAIADPDVLQGMLPGKPVLVRDAKHKSLWLIDRATGTRRAFMPGAKSPELLAAIEQLTILQLIERPSGPGANVGDKVTMLPSASIAAIPEVA